MNKQVSFLADVVNFLQRWQNVTGTICSPAGVPVVKNVASLGRSQNLPGRVLVMGSSIWSALMRLP